MSFDSLLIDTCTIQEYTEGDIDDYGIAAKEWTDFLANESCRLVANTNREVKVGAEVVIADYILYTNDVGITEQYRVVINSITYEILSAIIRSDGVGGHHQECLLRVIK